MKKKLTTIISLLLILSLCMAFAACGDDDGGSSGSKKKKPEEKVIGPGYIVGDSTVHLVILTDDPESLGDVFPELRTDDGWAVLGFRYEGGDLSYGEMKDFLNKVKVENQWWNNVHNYVTGEYKDDIEDSDHAILDNDELIYIAFDMPEDFELTEDKVNIDWQEIANET